LDASAGGGASVDVSALATVMRITAVGLESSIHRVNWEQVYTVFPDVTRARAKVLIDALAIRIAEAAAALLLFARVRQAVGEWLRLDATAVVVFALAAATVVRSRRDCAPAGAFPPPAPSAPGGCRKPDRPPRPSVRGY